jgi:pimeloyl-ACP methyl ester carboxylesterase
MGHEYVFTHRLYCQVARKLAALGLHVLRFDYYATGDSAGAPEEGRLPRWVSNAMAAVDELRARSAVRSVDIGGLRMGGAVALLTAAQHRGVDRVVMWDPVVTGPEYLDEVLALQAAMLRYPPGSASRSAVTGDGRLREIIGFPLTEPMLDDLLGLDLSRLTELPMGRCLLVDTTGDPNQQKLLTHLELQGVRVQYDHSPHQRIWAQDPYQTLLPHKAIDTVVGWLGERTA